ncbi:MAG TPA: hypothetical protein VFP28_09485 [Gemmatimonadales bacterium]|nr:hypothetical protein [Gemmatimonadales bacterium]
MRVPNLWSVRVPGLLLLGASGGLTVPSLAGAQHRAPPPDAWDVAPLTRPSPGAVDVEPRRRDYRWVGTAIGGGALGIAAALEAAAACGNSENGPRDCTGVILGVGVLGAVVGGGIGNLVGRAFKRD